MKSENRIVRFLTAVTGNARRVVLSGLRVNKQAACVFICVCKREKVDHSHACCESVELAYSGNWVSRSML